MKTAMGPHRPKILVNASNLHGGGGVAVASSAVSALAALPDAAGSITVLASTEVAQNLMRMGASLEAFAEYMQFDTYGLSALIRKKPLRYRDFDAVFTVFGPLYSPVVGAKNVMGFAQPWVAYPHNSAYSLLAARDRLKTRLKFELVAAFFATADVLIVEQEHVRKALRKRRLFRSKTVDVVPSVVDSIYFDETRWSPVSLPPRAGDLRLGVVSRNYTHKNLGILPQVKTALKENHGIDAEFFVTFSDDEYASCSSDFRDNVSNHGTLALAECPSFNSQLDGVVFPTLLECFSATPIEALAVRTPLFASDRPFIRDTVGKHARYFDPLDPESIARCIYDYFRLPTQEQNEMTEAGFQHVASADYSSLDRAVSLLRIVEQAATGQTQGDPERLEDRWGSA